MRIGLNLQADSPPGEFIELVRLIDDAGFESLWLADSTLTYRHVFVYLTLAAEHSRRLRIGSAVNHPHVRHPADTLAALAAVDELSGGRAALGFGTGDHWVEHAGVRIATVDEVREAVELLRSLLTANRPLSFHGQRWQLKDAELPYRLRHDLPVYVAASNPRMLALAGELGDGALAFVGADPSVAARARAQVGQPRPGFDFVLACGCSLDRNEQRAREDAAARLDFLERSASKLVPRLREAPDPIRAYAIAGTPPQALAQLRRLSDAGFEHVLLLPRGQLRRQTIELLAAEVLPRL